MIKDWQEAIKNEKCSYFLDKQITATKFYRAKVPVGLKLKRSPIDYLEEKDLFTPKELLNLYVGIVGKKTELPMAIRATILMMVRNAINETIKFYETDNRTENIADTH